MVVFILARRVIFRLFLSAPISFLHLDSRLLDISDDLLSDTPTGGGGLGLINIRLRYIAPIEYSAPGLHCILDNDNLQN